MSTTRLVCAATILALLALAPACPPQPSPPVPTLGDAAIDLDGAADDCAAACAVVKALRCASGASPLCHAVCLKQDGKLGDWRPHCVAGATSRAAVRACSPAWGCD